MSSEPKFTLSEFVRVEIATREEWLEWERVKDAARPTARTRPEPTSDIPFTREIDEPSADYVRRSELEAELLERLRESLGSGRWIVSGRLGPARSRQDLESSDWASAKIVIKRNAIGNFANVDVRAQRPETNREVLQRFIERICDAAGEPGKALTKPVIRGLANRLYPENFREADFMVAWTDAQIHDEWRKSGRRGKSDSS